MKQTKDSSLKSEIREYNGLALAKYRPGTNCWGHLENESCIHLKFGAPFKYASFTKEFCKKNKQFVELYDQLSENKPNRDNMLSLWKQIIGLFHKKQLVVVFNMCDYECINFLSIAYYVILENRNDFNFTLRELIDDNEYLNKEVL